MLNFLENKLTIKNLQTLLHGQLILPGDEAYESARGVWNATADRHPALIIRPQSVADVITAVTFARGQQMEVSVRSGGHNMAGYGTNDAGLVIGLSRMKALTVDPQRRIARIEPGLTWGEVAQTLQPHGLALTSGDTSSVGVGGLLLGGGIGWMVRKYGLAIDRLHAVELVTADGEFLRASAAENAELFWGLRGGGGNFGIATAFEFQLHPVGPLLSGKVVYPLSRAREVLRFYRQYTSSVLDELTAYASLLTTPGGEPAIAISLCYCGALQVGERLVEPVRKLGSPLVDLIRPQSCLKLVTRADAGAPPGRHYYQRARTLTELSDEAIETLADYGAACTSPCSQILLQHVHGAASRVSPTATAFALREPSYVVSVLAAIPGGEAARHIAWARACWGALSPFASRGVYVNFLGNEEEERVRAAYGVNYERLVALKHRYDPTNFFSRNQNIRPTVSQPRPPGQAPGDLAA